MKFTSYEQARKNETCRGKKLTDRQALLGENKDFIYEGRCWCPSRNNDVGNHQVYHTFPLPSVYRLGYCYFLSPISYVASQYYILPQVNLAYNQQDTIRKGVRNE